MIAFGSVLVYVSFHLTGDSYSVFDFGVFSLIVGLTLLGIEEELENSAQTKPTKLIVPGIGMAIDAREITAPESGSGGSNPSMCRSTSPISVKPDM
ncbi:MAG: hypothetical protein QW767_06685 [Thermoprotei archaeon]